MKVIEVKKLNNVKLVTMMQVNKNIICENIFPHIEVKNTFGEVIENSGLKSLRIAETSKYPHVNHFFDGDKDVKYKNTYKNGPVRKDKAGFIKPDYLFRRSENLRTSRTEITAIMDTIIAISRISPTRPRDSRRLRRTEIKRTDTAAAMPVERTKEAEVRAAQEPSQFAAEEAVFIAGTKPKRLMRHLL